MKNYVVSLSDGDLIIVAENKKDAVRIVKNEHFVEVPIDCVDKLPKKGIIYRS